MLVKVLKVLMVLRVHKDNQELMLVKVLKVLLEHKVLKDIRVTKVDYLPLQFPLVVLSYGLVQQMLFHLDGFYVMVTTAHLKIRFVVGAGNGSGAGNSNYSVGDNGGAEFVTLSVAQMPSHTHGDGTYTTSSVGNHSHSYVDQQNDGNGGYRWWKGGDNDCILVV